MSKRLRDNLTSDYFGAANRLNSRQQRKKIIAYVESYDDVFFWRSILSQFETDSYYFEIMLPTRQNVLERGKKAALMSALSGKTGQWLIACVDADYGHLYLSHHPQQSLRIPHLCLCHREHAVLCALTP